MLFWSRLYIEKDNIFWKCRHYLTLFLRVLDINVKKLCDIFSQLLCGRAEITSLRVKGRVNSCRESVHKV